MIINDTNHKPKKIKDNFFKSKPTMKKVKINSNNLISDPEINKVSLKYQNKTASLINKKIITLSQKKINSNKP